MSRLIGSRYVDTEFWSKNAVLGNTSAGNDDTDCARKRMTKCHLPWVWNGSIVIIIFFKKELSSFILYNIMVFLHKSAVSTELGTAFSFPGLYKSMNRFFYRKQTFPCKSFNESGFNTKVTSSMNRISSAIFLTLHMCMYIQYCCLALYSIQY